MNNEQYDFSEYKIVAKYELRRFLINITVVIDYPTEEIIRYT